MNSITSPSQEPQISSSLYFRWGFPANTPENFEEVRFPLAFHEAPDEKGFYFSWQFYFLPNSTPAYTGFLPKKYDLGGELPKDQVYSQFAFSTFSGLARHDDPDFCQYGADGGPGVSCSSRSLIKKNVFYSCRVTTLLTGNVYYYTGTLWNDEEDTEVVHIGTWSLPNNGTSGPIHKGYVGFIEPYSPVNAKTQTLVASFGRPIGIDYTTGRKFVGNPIEPSPVSDEAYVKYSWEETEDGIVKVKAEPNNV